MSYEEKKLKVRVVYFTIFKIRKYVIYYLRLPFEQYNVYVTGSILHIMLNIIIIILIYKLLY